MTGREAPPDADRASPDIRNENVDGVDEGDTHGTATATDDLPPLRTDLTPVVDAVRAADAAGFVAIGDRFDDDIRYLTRFSGPDRAYGLVVLPGDGDAPPRATLLAPRLFVEQAEREFVDAAATDDDGEAPTARSGGDEEPRTTTAENDFHDGIVRTVDSDRLGDPAGVRAAATLDTVATPDPERDGPPSVLVPASIPHDAAVHLEQAGYALESTTVVTTARATKTPAEVARIRRVQRAAAAGIARAETVLAASEPVESGGERRELRWEGEPLTTERLRRAVNATLAAHGVRAAGNTVIGAGPTAADLHYVGTDPIRAGETVLLDLSPRGSDGYYGDLTRTFVVDGDGGWDRRAYVAVEAAREAALAELAAGPGVTAATIHREAAAELAAYGFDPSADEGAAGFTHGTGHGVGVSLHESPSLSADVPLEPGHVVTVEPGVYDPDIGGVRLEDLVVVTDTGYELLAEYPFESTPTERT